MIRLLIISIFPLLLNAQNNELINYPKDSNVNILFVGDYKVGELNTKILDRQWWGLYVKDNTSFIRKVSIKIDDILPDIQNDWQYRISVDDNKYCVVLFSGIEIFEKDITHYTNNDIIRNKDFTFEFGPYHTFLSSKLETSKLIGEVKLNNYSISLNYQTNNKLTNQELFLFPTYDTQLLLSLVWAGDLDNDGKTDFLLQLPTPPNNELGYSSGLYLSSIANADELVKLVAYFISRGC